MVEAVLTFLFVVPPFFFLFPYVRGRSGGKGRGALCLIPPPPSLPHPWYNFLRRNRSSNALLLLPPSQIRHVICPPNFLPSFKEIEKRGGEIIGCREKGKKETNSWSKSFFPGDEEEKKYRVASNGRRRCFSSSLLLLLAHPSFSSVCPCVGMRKRREERGGGGDFLPPPMMFGQMIVIAWPSTGMGR